MSKQILKNGLKKIKYQVQVKNKTINSQNKKSRFKNNNNLNNPAL